MSVSEHRVGEGMDGGYIVRNDIVTPRHLFILFIGQHDFDLSLFQMYNLCALLFFFPFFLSFIFYLVEPTLNPFFSFIL